MTVGDRFGGRRRSGGHVVLRVGENVRVNVLHLTLGLKVRRPKRRRIVVGSMTDLADLDAQPQKCLEQAKALWRQHRAAPFSSVCGFDFERSPASRKTVVFAYVRRLSEFPRTSGQGLATTVVTRTASRPRERRSRRIVRTAGSRGDPPEPGEPRRRLRAA